MKVFDLHCDTIGILYEQKNSNNEESLAKNKLHVDIEKLKQGGGFIQTFALYDDKNKSGYDMEYMKKFIDYYEKTVSSLPELNPVRNAADIKEDKINALLSIEDAGSLNGSEENLRYAYSRGVRMIALMWNYENAYGYPNSSEEKIMNAGLKEKGIQAISLMNELGIIPDVSHMSYGCFWDTCKYSRTPFTASHSCMQTLTRHTRNLTDDMLVMLADKGGVCGINFCSLFINGSDDMTYISDVVRQAKYMYKVAGIDCIAMGSDFDGISNGLEFDDFSGMVKITEALMQNGFSYEQTEKIMYKNALRVFQSVCQN